MWHDAFGGVCHCNKHKDVGQNILGKILMEVRNNV